VSDKIFGLAEGAANFLGNGQMPRSGLDSIKKSSMDGGLATGKVKQLMTQTDQ